MKYGQNLYLVKCEVENVVEIPIAWTELLINNIIIIYFVYHILWSQMKYW